MPNNKNAVAFCVTSKHIQLTAVSIASIVKNYGNEAPLDILIVAEDLLSQDIDRIRKIPEYYNKNQINIFVWSPPQITERITGYQNERFPKVTLWRMFLPFYFPMYERILYLDNDTIVYRDVSEFFYLTDQGSIIAAVRDFYFYIIGDSDNVAASFGVPSMKNYFNSGFLIFNTRAFNQAISVEVLITMINENNYQYLDQTILNIVCHERTQFLPFSYNYQKDNHWLEDWAEHYNEEAALDIKRCRDDVAVRHFIEFEKDSMPWEHFSVLDHWEWDFWQYLTDLKQMDYTKNG